MTITMFLACTSQSRLVEESAIASNHSGFTDDDRMSVIDEQTRTDLCRRMNVDGEDHGRERLKHQGERLSIFKPENMRDSVCLNALKSLKVQKHRDDITNGRIAAKNGIQVREHICDQARILFQTVDADPT